MDSYSLADATARFSELIDKVESGEEVEITRHGKTVARVIPSEQPVKKVDVDRLRKLTDSQSMQTEGAGAFIRRMRDDARY